MNCANSIIVVVSLMTLNSGMEPQIDRVKSATNMLENVIFCKEPPVLDATKAPAEWTVVWFTGMRLTNATAENEVIGLVFGSESAISVPSTNNFTVEHLKIVMARASTVASFRSYRESLLVVHMGELERAKMNWVHATYGENDSWTFVNEAPTKRDLAARERFTATPLGDSDAGFCGRPELALLPEPFATKGIGIVSRKLKGLSWPAQWPADATCNWVLSWDDAASKGAVKTQIKEASAWIDGRQQQVSLDPRLFKAP